jgi:ferredoxin
MTAGARLRVNPIACDSRGLCAEVLPELITLDDWGFPIIVDQDVPPALRREAAEAVRICPLLALRLDHPSAPAGCLWPLTLRAHSPAEAAGGLA